MKFYFANVQKLSDQAKNEMGSSLNCYVIKNFNIHSHNQQSNYPNLN